MFTTRPCSAVSIMYDFRCASDYRSRGREFDPDPVPYFGDGDRSFEIISTAILLPSAYSFEMGVVVGYK